MSLSKESRTAAENTFHKIYKRDESNLAAAFAGAREALQGQGASIDDTLSCLSSILSDVRKMIAEKKPWPDVLPSPPPADPIDLTKFTIRNLCRSSLKKAKATVTMTKATLSNRMDVNMEFDPINWDRGNMNKLHDELFCVGWIEGGDFCCTFVDWSVKDRGYTKNHRTLENLIPGRKGPGMTNGHLPPAGADFYVWLESNDGKERTTIANAGKW